MSYAAPVDGASGVIAGTYGSNSSVPQIQIGSDGKIRSVVTYPVSASGTGSSLNDAKIWVGDSNSTAQQQSVSGDATVSNSGVVALKATGTAGTYGADALIPVVTTDAQGRIESISTVAPSVSVTMGDCLLLAHAAITAWGAGVIKWDTIVGNYGTSISWDVATGLFTFNATGVYWVTWMVRNTLAGNGSLQLRDAANVVYGQSPNVVNTNGIVYSGSAAISVTAGDSYKIQVSTVNLSMGTGSGGVANNRCSVLRVL